MSAEASLLAWAPLPLAALLAGLAGTPHCLGMCGGISAALGCPRQVPGAVGLRPDGPLLALQAGRLCGYGLLGALAGLAGANLAARGMGELPLSGPNLRLALALMMVLIGLQIAYGRAPLGALERLGDPLWRRVQRPAARLRHRAGLPARFAAGLLWALLPCGLLYGMLAAAAASGSALHGALLLVSFGLGTLPALLASAMLPARLFALAGSGRRGLGLLVAGSGLWVALMPLLLTAGAHMH